MRNKFGIPTDVMLEITSRDKNCAYCSKRLIYPYDPTNRNDSATIEHLDFDGPFYWIDDLKPENIVMVCGSCNSSRGIKLLNKWLESEYCLSKNITNDTVSLTVKQYLINNPLK
jgi:hypothetical protein